MKSNKEGHKYTSCEMNCNHLVTFDIFKRNKLPNHSETNLIHGRPYSKPSNLIIPSAFVIHPAQNFKALVDGNKRPKKLLHDLLFTDNNLLKFFI